MTKAAGVVLVGFGAIGGAVAALLLERGQAGRIVAVGLRGGAPPRVGLPPGVPILTDPGQLAGVGAGLVVEIASRAAVAPRGGGPHLALDWILRFPPSRPSRMQPCWTN